MNKKATKARLKNWLEIFVDVAYMVGSPEIKDALSISCATLALPSDILEVLIKYGVVFEARGKYFFECGTNSGVILLELLGNDDLNFLLRLEVQQK